MTNQEIAERADVALTTVARELAIEPEKTMSLALALRLGDVMGFSPPYAAIAHARDAAREYIRKRDLSSRLANRFRVIADELDRAARGHAPLRADDTGRRMALRAERCRRGPTSEPMSSCLERAGVEPADVHDYEMGRRNLPDQALTRLLRELSALSPRLTALSVDRLDDLAQPMRALHSIPDTLVWRSFVEFPEHAARFACPHETDFDLRFGVSPSLWPGLETRMIRAVRPSAAKRRIQIVGTAGRGIHLAMAIKGNVHVTASRVPFHEQSGRSGVQFTCAREDILHERKCRPGDAVIGSDGHHYRLEFQSPNCLISVISIVQNVLVRESDMAESSLHVDPGEPTQSRPRARAVPGVASDHG